MQGKFMIVRVEDYFSDVKYWTEVGSEFLGLNRFEIFEGENSVGNFMAEHKGEIRNRVKNFDDWRWSEDIDFEMVAGVQKVCENAMKLAGYKIVDNLEDLKNKTVILH